jgi:hypothetical protein
LHFAIRLSEIFLLCSVVMVSLWEHGWQRVVCLLAIAVREMLYKAPQVVHLQVTMYLRTPFLRADISDTKLNGYSNFMFQ